MPIVPIVAVSRDHAPFESYEPWVAAVSLLMVAVGFASALFAGPSLAYCANALEPPARPSTPIPPAPEAPSNNAGG